MQLDPETQAAVIERTAELLADRVCAEMGGLDGLLVVDLGTVSQMTGQSKAWVRNFLPVKRITPRTSGVLLADLKNYLTNCKS